MPQKIYLIRHGETDYNASRRMQGWLDIPLNEVGREQANLSASKLVGVSIDHIYSSDLRRAYETAQHISRVVKKDIITTTQLRERDMGIFSGWRWEHERDKLKDELWKEFEHSRDSEDLHWNGIMASRCIK
jgi:probable phosphoglycerate mutase